MSAHYKSRQPSVCAGIVEDAAIGLLDMLLLAAIVFLVVPFCVIASLALWVKEGVCRMISKKR